jgi:hypothetical protein
VYTSTVPLYEPGKQTDLNTTSIYSTGHGRNKIRRGGQKDLTLRQADGRNFDPFVSLNSSLYKGVSKSFRTK